MLRKAPRGVTEVSEAEFFNLNTELMEKAKELAFEIFGGNVWSGWFFSNNAVPCTHRSSRQQTCPNGERLRRKTWGKFNFRSKAFDDPTHFTERGCLGLNPGDEVTCLMSFVGNDNCHRFYVTTHLVGKCPWKKPR